VAEARCDCGPVPGAVVRRAGAVAAAVEADTGASAAVAAPRAPAAVVEADTAAAAAACCGGAPAPAVVVRHAAAVAAERQRAGWAAPLARAAPERPEAHKAGLPAAAGVVALAAALPTGLAAPVGAVARLEAHSVAAAPEPAGLVAGPMAARRAAPVAEPADAAPGRELQVVAGPAVAVRVEPAAA
jgi:hypothetical protein